LKMYTNFFPKLYGVMPKGLSVFSLRKKIFEESVRNLMKYFSSYDFCLSELYVVIFGDPVYAKKSIQPQRPTGLPQQITFLISFIFAFSRPNDSFPLVPDFEKYGLNGSF